MVHRFAIGVSVQRILGSVPEIEDRPRHSAPPDKMHGELGSHVARLRAIALFQPEADLAVPSYALAWGDPLVEHFVIEGMAKAIARCERPIRPCRRPLGVQELPTPCHRLTVGFDV